MGNNDYAKEGDLIIMETDLRSDKKEERTLKMFINGKQQKSFFNNIPELVRFGVWEGC